MIGRKIPLFFDKIELGHTYTDITPLLETTHKYSKSINTNNHHDSSNNNNNNNKQLILKKSKKPIIKCRSEVENGRMDSRIRELVLKVNRISDGSSRFRHSHWAITVERCNYVFLRKVR